MNYLKNVLDSTYKSIAPANIPSKIEMNTLARFEVIQIASFSERQLISRKFTAEVYKAEVYKASAESHQSLLIMCPEFILLWTSLFQNMPCFCSLTIENCLLMSNRTTEVCAIFYTLLKST